MAKLIQDFQFAPLYFQILREIVVNGSMVTINRVGVQTKELTAVTVHLTDARNNILVHPARSVNYRFMLAEWFWILAGREDVGSISYFNSKIAKYSDDGKIFAGAYGPRLASQWQYLIDTLTQDMTSRQAVATIWTPCPPKTRDTPCTVSCQFLIRGGKLHGIFNMRSSDVWKGLVYDVFNFSMLTNWLAGEVGWPTGSLTLNLGSSHLYEEEWKLAETVLARPGELETIRSPQLDTKWGGVRKTVPDSILWGGSEPQTEPWHTYAKALRGDTSAQALELLRSLR